MASSFKLGCPEAPYATEDSLVSLPFEGFILPSSRATFELLTLDDLPALLEQLVPCLAELEHSRDMRQVQQELQLLRHGTSAAHLSSFSAFEVRERGQGLRHRWGLFVSSVDMAVVWFDHSHYGERSEEFVTLSEAFGRLSSLLTGVTCWQNFGAPRSRQILLGRGQFYWPCATGCPPIPVDHIEFQADNGYQLAIESVQNKAVLCVKDPQGSMQWRWLDHLGEGLVELAAFLEGSKSVATPDAPMEGEPLTGHFVVKSIFENNDVLAAPVLEFLTAVEQRVTLSTSDETWSVRFQAPSVEVVETAAPAQALRYLAQLLQGDFSFTEPTWLPLP